MPFAAGEIITAGRLNRLQPVPREAAATNDLTLTTAEQDILGASITVITQTANAVYLAYGVFDMSATTGAAGVIMVGRLAVDGVSDTEEAHADGSTTGARITASQDWRGTLATAGSHTLKLRGLKSAAGGTMLARTIHSKLTVVIYEVV